MLSKKIILCVFLALFSLHNLYPQDSPHFDMSGFPQWARDLRRAEIVAIGSFPFTYFLTNFSFGMYRYSTNDWDRRYAPWPITGPGAIEPTNKQKISILGIAAGGAIIVSIVDFSIERSKRNRMAREAEMYPEGTPIIITRPLTEDVSAPERP